MKLLSHKLEGVESRERFLREGKLAAAINHPNSVYVYGTDQIDGIPIIVMELLRGGTLQDKLDREGTFSVEDAVKAILDVIAGLEAAAEKGILHRDIKPANCFVDIDGTVKVGDYGLSISTEARIDPIGNRVTQPGVIVGTPAFASPEQLRGEELDVRSDIYSVGVTLYYLLKGRLPFGSQGQNLVQFIAQVLEASPPEVGHASEGADPKIAMLINKCLEKKPNNRFASYQELRKEMQVPEFEPAGLVRRCFAWCIDQALLSSILVPAVSIGNSSVFGLVAEFSFLWTILFHASLETAWGASPGKWCCDLRVTGLKGERPTLLKASLRAGIVTGLPLLVADICQNLYWHGQEIVPDVFNWSDLSTTSIVVALIQAVVAFINYFIVFRRASRETMKRGLHEVASGTRTIRLIDQAATSSWKSQIAAVPTEYFETSLSRIGPYRVVGEIMSLNDSDILFCRDDLLDRDVYVRLFAIDCKSLFAKNRQDIARRTRLRWLSNGKVEGRHWEAYEAVCGTPLRKAISSATWDSIPIWWADLIDELADAETDETSPDKSATDYLWIGTDNHLRVLDFPVHAVMTAPTQEEAEQVKYSVRGPFVDQELRVCEVDFAKPTDMSKRYSQRFLRRTIQPILSNKEICLRPTVRGILDQADYLPLADVAVRLKENIQQRFGRNKQMLLLLLRLVAVSICLPEVAVLTGFSTAYEISQAVLLAFMLVFFLALASTVFFGSTLPLRLMKLMIAHRGRKASRLVQVGRLALIGAYHAAPLLILHLYGDTTPIALIGLIALAFIVSLVVNLRLPHWQGFS